LDQFILQARQKKNWMFGITERLDLTYDPRKPYEPICGLSVRGRPFWEFLLSRSFTNMCIILIMHYKFSINGERLILPSAAGITDSVMWNLPLTISTMCEMEA